MHQLMDKIIEALKDEIGFNVTSFKKGADWEYGSGYPVWVSGIQIGSIAFVGGEIALKTDNGPMYIQSAKDAVDVIEMASDHFFATHDVMWDPPTDGRP